jgi:hypothetical protein
MATLAAGPATKRRHDPYVWMAGLGLVIALASFTPTFFLPLAGGQFVRAPVFFLHAGVFFAWVAFYFVQTRLAASGRLTAHREWGLFGAALATAMAFSVTVVVISRLNQVPAIPYGPGSARFAWVDLWGLLFFEGCILLALTNTRRPDIHRRLMLMASLSILNAPLARWTPLIFGGPLGPARTPVPFIQDHWYDFTVLGLILIVAVIDRRTFGRFSWVYLLGAPVYLAFSLSTDPVGYSATWLSFAEVIRHLGG